MKSVFFCGDKSLYGISHLVPLLESKLGISKVVIADQKRWDIFRNALGGVKYFTPDTYWKTGVKYFIKKIINKIRSNKRKHIDIFDECKKKKIEIEIVNNVNNVHFINNIKNEKYNLFISAAYPQIFSKKLLDVPDMGAVNFHPSALPKFRGAHPHYWALAKGYPEGGVTVHYMTPQIDDGDIISQIRFPILNYDYPAHYKKIISESENIVKKLEDFIFSDEKSTVPQDINEVTYFRNNREIHHCIFWSTHSSEDVCNMVRAGGAFFIFKNKKCYVAKLSSDSNNRNMTNSISVPEGAVVDFGENNFVVKCQDGYALIEQVHINGRKLSAHQFAKKYSLNIGALL